MLYLGLGTNLGNRIDNLTKAKELIVLKIGKILRESSIYETAAWGITEQDTFLNQVIALKSRKSAANILKIILAIEQEMGRFRVNKWGPRLIDIDILYYDKKVISQDDLQIPHPFIKDRRFVLEPLVEIAADFIHPLSQKSNQYLLNECTDTGEIRKYEK